ncbi:MAG: aldo/keto reductase, partial [Oscillospiraceae bacterium]|nr:aldo/keto reductase [Oscillospiraceae bacterium]
MDKNCAYKLSNGVEIPCIGFGMWQTPDTEVGINAVKSAIEAGYTHIDTAQAYGNEDCVGKAIAEIGA